MEAMKHINYNGKLQFYLKKKVIFRDKTAMSYCRKIFPGHYHKILSENIHIYKCLHQFLVFTVWNNIATFPPKWPSRKWTSSARLPLATPTQGHHTHAHNKQYDSASAYGFVCEWVQECKTWYAWIPLSRLLDYSMKL